MLLDLGVSSMQVGAAAWLASVADGRVWRVSLVSLVCGKTHPHPSTTNPNRRHHPLTPPLQLDTPDRGFSFAADGPLDMRLNPDAPQSAADLVNGMSEAALGRVLLEYGEERMWKVVARRCGSARCECALRCCLSNFFHLCGRLCDVHASFSPPPPTPPPPTHPKRIVEAREAAPIVTTQQLVRAVGQTVFRGKGSKAGGKQIHPATRTFQVGLTL
jgi:16S rRNA (cytosine1402-N4)-methyltransferase